MKKNLITILSIIAVAAVITCGILAYKYSKVLKNNNPINNQISTTTEENLDINLATSTSLQNQVATSSDGVSWNLYKDAANNISIQYPTLNNVSLKPSIATSSKNDIDANGCLPQQTESGQIAKETIFKINGVNFCGSQNTGAAMSHRYNLYYYTFLHDGNYYTLTYDATTVVCDVYDFGSVGFQNCEAKTKFFPYLIPLIKQSLTTLQFN